MKISIIANGFQEDYTLNLINALAKQDVDVDFIGSNIYDPALIDKKIVFHRVRKEDRNGGNPLKKGFWIFQYFIWLLGYLFRERKLVIHIQWLRFNFIDGVFFPLMARLLGHRVVYTAHDVIPHSIDNKRIRVMFRLIYRSQNEIVVHTNYIRDRIHTEFGIDQSKITVVKHGIYAVPERNRKEFAISKKAFGIGEDEFVLLFFGIVTEYKGLDLLAQSMKILQRDMGRKVRLLVAGRVQTGYEAEMARLRKEELGEEVVYFLRFIETEEVSQLFGAADATVLPYREASQSGVMFMSYAHGVPVVLPDLGGFPDDVISGTTGFLFNPGDPESLSSQLGQAISHFGTNNVRLREEIIHLTSEMYQWEGSAGALVKIYQN